MDSINLEPSSPTGHRSLELERSSRQQGSGIDGASICATWWLDQLWGRRQARSMGRSAALMRTLQACLEIGMEAERLVLRNSVTVGALSLCFYGHGQLQGRRPLLQFSFDRLQVRWGERILLERSLPQPEARKLPFFALDRPGTPGGRGLAGRQGQGGRLGALAPQANCCSRLRRVYR